MYSTFKIRNVGHHSKKNHSKSLDLKQKISYLELNSKSSSKYFNVYKTDFTINVFGGRK